MGRPLPCGRPRWRKSWAERRKIRDGSPGTLPGAPAQAKGAQGHTHTHMPTGTVEDAGCGSATPQARAPV